MRIEKFTFFMVLKRSGWLGFIDGQSPAGKTMLWEGFPLRWLEITLYSVDFQKVNSPLSGRHSEYGRSFLKFAGGTTSASSVPTTGPRGG